MSDILEQAIPFPISQETSPVLPVPTIPIIPLKKSKFISIIIILVVILLVFVGVFVLYFSKIKSGESSTLTTPSPSSASSVPIVEEGILLIIPNITPPMVWTPAVDGVLMDANGNEVQGKIITTQVTTKEENKFAGLLVTDSPLVIRYGWVEDPSGMAAGIGEQLFTYSKNNRKLIIRYSDGLYRVLLSK